MAGGPPSLLAPPQRTVLCLHPRDLQERGRGGGAGRDERMEGGRDMGRLKGRQGVVN